MNIWVDDVRPAPKNYIWLTSVNETKSFIKETEANWKAIWEKIRNGEAEVSAAHEFYINVIDLDHDAGDYAHDGGDYIRILDWLEETGRSYPIRIHSMNTVGCENMRAIIEKNNWREVRHEQRY